MGVVELRWWNTSMLYKVVFGMSGVGLWRCLCGVAFRRRVLLYLDPDRNLAVRQMYGMNGRYRRYVQYWGSNPRVLVDPPVFAFLVLLLISLFRLLALCIIDIQACYSVAIGRPTRIRFSFSSAAHILSSVIRLGNAFPWNSMQSDLWDINDSLILFLILKYWYTNYQSAYSKLLDI